MKFFIFLITAALLLFAVPLNAAYIDDAPDKGEAPSPEVDKIKDNFIWLKAALATVLGGLNDSDATEVYLMGPVDSVVGTAYTTRKGTDASATYQLQILNHNSDNGTDDVLTLGAYSGSRWYNIGNFLPVVTAIPVAAGSTGEMRFVTNESATYAYNGSFWRKIADQNTTGVTTIDGDTGAAAAGKATIAGGTGITTLSEDTTNTITVINSGVTGITGSSGSSTTGAVIIAGGAGITTSSTASTVTIVASAASSTINGFIDVFAAEPGDDYPPDTEWLGSNDYTGVPVHWFSADTSDTVSFGWSVPDDCDQSKAVTITAWCIVENSPAASTSDVVRMELYSKGRSGFADTDPYSFDLDTAQTDRSPGNFAAYSSGSPFTYIKPITFTADLSTFPDSDFVNFFVRRDHDYASDDYANHFGVTHYRIWYAFD